MSGLPEGYRHLKLGDVGSTNTECVERARAGDPGHLWITAQRQLQGRGSRGRNWVSEAGNLYASVLISAPWPIKSLSQLTYVASLALRDALQEASALFGQSPDFRLKWPNDVLADGKKIAGILLESHEIGGRRIVVCGMGTNLQHHPADTLHPSTSLRELGVNLLPDDLFPLLATAFDRRLSQWAGGENFAGIRENWQGAASGIGKSARVVLPGADGDRTILGTLMGLDEDGAMKLRREDGSVEKITTADIFFA